MTIDNLKYILPLLNFESGDDFYYLQILQRKKENPHLGSNSRVIKNYYIKSREYLEERYEEIKALCEMFNARASLRLNKRSFEKTAYKALVNSANCMANREYEFVGKAYDRAVGQGHNDKDKKWILDVDSRDFNINELVDYINTLQPEGDKIWTVLLSKSGYHIITRPFNLKDFKERYPEIEVHKDNPTNLYIPKENNNINL
ncbi:MAG: hypothetical protein KDH96_05225 [Candidatus Riesia sp.]|nr:hypothetical protein [Candidatus Riesia sp.]